MFSFDRDCKRLAPFTIVFATSKAKIEILFPFVVTPEVKPLLFRLVTLLLRVSKTSTAFSPALPSNEPTSETYKTSDYPVKNRNVVWYFIAMRLKAKHIFSQGD